MPVWFYNSPDLFAAELDTVFRTAWICVGRLEQVERPGDFFTLELAGEPVVVVRGVDGVLRALSNVCRHRYFSVAAGKGNARRFTCPYHLWTYELDGRLRGAPHMGDIRDSRGEPVRLPAFGIDTWQGFIFVTLAADAPPLRAQLAGADAFLEHYNMADWRVTPWVDEVWPGNWKLAMETALEGYHVAGLHAGTIDTFMPSSSARFQASSADWTLFRLDTRYEGGYASLRSFAERMPPGEDRSSAPQFGFFPNCAVSCSQMSSIWLTFLALDCNHTRVIGGNLVPPDLYARFLENEHERSENAAAVEAVNVQDASAMVNLQRNVGSRYAEPGLLSEKERNLLCFYRYLGRSLAGQSHARAAEMAR